MTREFCDTAVLPLMRRRLELSTSSRYQRNATAPKPPAIQVRPRDTRITVPANSINHVTVYDGARRAMLG